MRLQQQRPLSALVAALGFACASPTGVTITDATVVRRGCWLLATGGDKYYQPVDLPSAFQVNGLAVRVVFREALDWGSVCMMGPMVHVEEIRVR